MNTVKGRITDTAFSPRLLPKGSFKYHPYEVYSLARGAAHVVFWADGVISHSGSASGEHDGLRDGGSSGHTDFSKVRVQYANLGDWLADGRPMPE